MDAIQGVFGVRDEKRRYGPGRGSSPFAARVWQTELFAQYVTDLELRDRSAKGPFQYCVFAGTGSGKTKAAGMLASHLLNENEVERIVILGPNSVVVQKTIDDFGAFFGLFVERFKPELHKDNDGYDSVGIASTYQMMLKRADIHHYRCGKARTLVIFDEVHHLGDEAPWGDSSLKAFSGATHVISLTGTPYRGDNTEIHFVNYETDPVNGVKVYKPDFTYGLARSIKDGVCKRPEFNRYRGTSGVRLGPWDSERELSYLSEGLNERDYGLLLRSCIMPGHPARRRMLYDAVSMAILEGRKMIINVSTINDAQVDLPVELQDLGLGVTPNDYEIIHEKVPNVGRKLKRFGSSQKFILINVDMVSEGVDIPELSMAVFLTNVTGRQKTEQRIGRVLRISGPNDFKTAPIFIFDDPEMLRIASCIESEIAALDPVVPKAKREPSEGEGEEQPRRFAAEFMPISGEQSEFITVCGMDLPRVEFDRERRRAIDRGWSLDESHVYARVKLIEEMQGNGDR